MFIDWVSRVAIAAYATLRYFAIIATAAIAPGRYVKRHNRRMAWQGSRVAAFNSGSAWRTLLELDRIARSNGAKIFAVSGTLLGIHRRGKLLPHDFDIDVGIFSDDSGLEKFISAVRTDPRVIKMKTRRMGRQTNRFNPWIPPVPNRAFIYKIDMLDLEDLSAPPVRIDIFLHVPALGFLAHGDANALWLNRPFDIVDTKVEGGRLYIPADCPAYLTENYGDYQVEKKDYDSLIDTPNVVNTYSLQAVRHLLKLQRAYIRSGRPDRLALVNGRVRDLISSLLRGPGRPPVWTIRAESSN